MRSRALPALLAAAAALVYAGHGRLRQLTWGTPGVQAQAAQDPSCLA